MFILMGSDDINKTNQITIYKCRILRIVVHLLYLI